MMADELQTTTDLKGLHAYADALTDPRADLPWGIGHAAGEIEEAIDEITRLHAALADIHMRACLAIQRHPISPAHADLTDIAQIAASREPG